jgi:uncharacterized protein YdhG (YjbR/CyaY superfamily)
MTIDEYLQSAPESHRSTLSELRKKLETILPEAEEGLSYGAPAFKVGGKAIAGFAFFKNHCSYFPHSGTVLAEMGDQLEGYHWSKGTLKFPADESLPKDLVKRLVDARKQELGLG